MKTIQLISLTIGIVLIITGRVQGYHMTEGEQLVELWPYWAGGTLFIVGGVLLRKIPPNLI